MANIQKGGAATLADLLSKRSSAIEKHLDGAIDVGKFLAAAMMCVRKDDKLARCSQGSFYAAVEAAAQVQLFPGPILGHCFLVPYGKDCTFVLGYKGMIALIQRCGATKSIARCVYANDTFDVVYGSEEQIIHKPKLGGDRGDFIGAYAIIFLKNGSQVNEFMDSDEINAIRKRSPSNRKGPWDTDFAEMARKTPLRRAFKWMPIDPGFEHLQEAAIKDEYEDANVPREVQADPVKADAPSDLEGLADEIVAEELEKPKLKAKAPKPKPQEVQAERMEKMDAEGEAEAIEYEEETQEALEEDVDKAFGGVDPASAPPVPWDDSAENGGYPFPVDEEATTIPHWWQDEVMVLGGFTWATLSGMSEDDPKQIKLSKLVRAGTAKYQKDSTVEPLSAKAAIVQAMVDAKEVSA